MSKKNKILEGIVYLFENNFVSYKGYDDFYYRFESIFNNKTIEIEIRPKFDEIDISFKGNFNYSKYCYDSVDKNFDKLLFAINQNMKLEKIDLGEEFIEDIKIFKRQKTIERLVN